MHDLIAFLEEHKDDETEYIICGGASIYRQSYPYAKKAYISFIKKEYEVDTRLDAFDPEDWDVVEEEDHEEFVYRELRRREPVCQAKPEEGSGDADDPEKKCCGKGLSGTEIH